MNRFRVTAIQVTIRHGIVALTPAQASAREYGVKKLTTPGHYAVEQPIYFKHGEEFGWDDVPNKALAQQLEAPAPVVHGGTAAPAPKKRGGGKKK